MTRPVKIKPPEKRYIRRDHSGRLIESLEFQEEKAGMSKRKQATHKQIEALAKAYVAAHPEVLADLTSIPDDPGVRAAIAECIAPIESVIDAVVQAVDRRQIDLAAFVLLFQGVDPDAATTEERAAAAETVAHVRAQLAQPIQIADLFGAT